MKSVKPLFAGREAVKHGLCDAVGEVRWVMREKFGEKVKFKHFGGPRTFLGAPIGASSFAAAVAAAAGGFGGGGDGGAAEGGGGVGGGGGGGGWGGGDGAEAGGLRAALHRGAHGLWTI